MLPRTYGRHDVGKDAADRGRREGSHEDSRGCRLTGGTRFISSASTMISAMTLVAPDTMSFDGSKKPLLFASSPLLPSACTRPTPPRTNPARRCFALVIQENFHRGTIASSTHDTRLFVQSQNIRWKDRLLSKLIDGEFVQTQRHISTCPRRRGQCPPRVAAGSD